MTGSEGLSLGYKFALFWKSSERKRVHTRASVCSGSSRVSLCLRRLLTCSSTSAKCSPALMHNLFCSDATTSFTFVVESYLNDLVCPFSRNTLSTLGNKAIFGSPPLNADTYNARIHLLNIVPGHLSNLT